jgi:hypothetical protein
MLWIHIYMAVERLKALKGRIHITAWQKCPNFPDDRSKDVVIKDETFDNLIVTVGKNSILRQLAGCGVTCGGQAGGIGVGCSTCNCNPSGKTDLVGASHVWKDISTADKTYASPTLFLSVDFGFSEANFTWNEIGLCDDKGTPNDPGFGSELWARQIDGTPLVKDNTKRAIVEWQLSL